MNFAALYGNQLDVELASADRAQLFTTARRQKAINDAQLAFVRLTKCTKRYGTIVLVNLTGEYDPRAAMSDYLGLLAPPLVQVITATQTYYIGGKNDLPRRDPEWLDWQTTGWRATPPSTPQAWYQRKQAGVEYLGLSPAPSFAVPGVDLWNLLVPYLGRPVDMVNDSDTPFTMGDTTELIRLEPYHQGLVHYAAAQLEPLRKGYDAITRQMATFAQYASNFLVADRLEGPDEITLERDYYAESHRGHRPRDPLRFP
jgi:hypothetical protein